MKKLYIHIGTHKTGSSAIQGSLICNPVFLEENDMHFLGYSLRENAHRLRHIDREQETLLDEERTRLESKINAVKQGTVILSSEEYVGNLDESYADAGEMAYKLSLVTQSFPSTVVIYLRRQDEIVESSYAQYIKQGAYYSFADFLRQYDIYRFDWHKLVSRYAELFGSHNLLIRPYEKNQLVDGDVVRDFYRTLGIVSLDNLLPHEFSNLGYSRAGLEIARVFNRIYHHNEPRKAHLKKVIQKRMQKNRYEDFRFFAYRERVELMKFYAASNRQLAIEYLDRESGRLFDASLSDYEAKKVRKNGLTVGDLLAGFRALFIMPLASKLRRLWHKLLSVN